MDSLTLAKRIQSADPMSDPQAVVAAKIGLLDYVASSLLAAGQEELEIVQRVYGIPDFDGINTVLQNQVSESARAICNGFRTHLLDIDDVHGDVRGHPGAVILSALLAAAASGASGNDFLAAYIVGVEVMARLGETVNPEHYLRGWHNTATLGSIAAAAALSRLFGINERQTAQALGIAATQAGGFRAQFGTPVKALHAGFAARNAIEAVRLVQAGIYGETEFLYKKFGFFDVFGYKYGNHDKNQNGFPASQPLYHEPFERGWGKNWRISQPGLWLKKYPFCSAALPGADAALLLRQHFAYQSGDIEKILIGFFPGRDAALYARDPATGEEGRFSIEYIVWLGLLGIPYDLEHFSKKPLTGELREALKRISRFQLEETAGDPFTQVTVLRLDGSKDTRSIAYPKGSPGNPLTLQDELEKLSFSIPQQEQREQMVLAIERLENDTIEECLKLIGTPFGRK